MERNKIFKKLLCILGAVATVFAIVFAMGKFDGEKANAAVELNQNNTVSFIDSVKIMVSHKDSTSEEFLNRKEVLNILKIDSSTLWSWEKTGYIKSFPFGGRKRYKLVDVEAIRTGRKGVRNGK